MKVYTLPKEVPFANPDYTNYDSQKENQREVAHKATLKAWLIKAGYTGKNTGGLLYIPHADGAAQYMLAEGSKSCLIHLPYGDAWDSPHAAYMPKKEVLRRIKASAALPSLFGN